MRRNPAKIPADTSVEAWQVEMRRRREQSPQERMAEFAAHNAAIAALHEAGIRARHPDYDDKSVLMAQFRAWYGLATAQEIWPGRDIPKP